LNFCKEANKFAANYLLNKNDMRTVKNILDTKDQPINTVEPTAMVIDALKKLIEVNLSYLIVFEDGVFKGLFSERDYSRKIVLEGRSSRETTVRDAMTTNLPEVTLENTVEDCMYQMNVRGTRYLVAYNGDEFAGIITIHDVLREALASKHEVFDNSLTNSLLNNDESGKIF
jgi:CBS domain-containing protein